MKTKREYCQWHETMETPAECSMKPTQPSHTPTPWKVDTGTQPHTLAIINEADDRQQAVILHDTAEDKANAAHIVKCVNAYQRHSVALGKLLALCQKSASGDPMAEVYGIVSKAMDSYDVQQALRSATGGK